VPEEAKEANMTASKAEKDEARQERLAKKLRKLEEKDPNLYYAQHLKDYMEQSDDPLHRENQMRQDDLLRVCVRPELSDENRTHILRRAWFQIQSKMIHAGVVTPQAFNDSCTCHVFAIRDRYLDFLREKHHDDFQAILEELRPFPNALIWFKGVATNYRGCPLEILKESYACLGAQVAGAEGQAGNEGV
jgi:hypothetical protein